MSVLWFLSKLFWTFLCTVFDSSFKMQRLVTGWKFCTSLFAHWFNCSPRRRCYSFYHGKKISKGNIREEYCLQRVQLRNPLSNVGPPWALMRSLRTSQGIYRIGDQTKRRDSVSTVILSTPEYWQTSFPQNWDKNTKHELNDEDVSSALSRVLTTLFIFNIHLLMIPWELRIIEFSKVQFLLLL